MREERPPLTGELMPETSEAKIESHGWSQFVPIVGPLWGGLLLDVADFFSFGPQSLVIGALAGAPLGWWIASLLGASQKWRLIAALAAIVYCILPATELLPLATIASAVGVLARATGRATSPPGTRRG